MDPKLIHFEIYLHKSRSSSNNLGWGSDWPLIRSRGGLNHWSSLGINWIVYVCISVRRRTLNLCESTLTSIRYSVNLRLKQIQNKYMISYLTMYFFAISLINSHLNMLNQSTRMHTKLCLHIYNLILDFHKIQYLDNWNLLTSKFVISSPLTFLWNQI